MTDFTSQPSQTPVALPRRSFLRVAGASAATVGLVLAGCGKIDPTPVSAEPTVLSFGSDVDTDKRVLNYIFFIKQLEYAFYKKVTTTFPGDMQPAEQAYFRDLREHELVHQQVLANVLGSTSLAALPFDFTSLNLTTRAGVLAAAKKIEDTASGAFLGILPRVNSFNIFALLTKISSVEARHAALVSDLLTTGSFAGPDVVTPLGQAASFTPSEVATAFKPFLPTLTINIDALPTA